MKPGELARQWAKEHPDYQGILYVRTYTARGRGGRLGSKRTTYDYYVSGGKATKSSSRRFELPDGSIGAEFNGVDDVTGEVHHKCVMDWFHLPHPQQGERVEPHKTATRGPDDQPPVYSRATFRTTPETAARLGAVRGHVWDNVWVTGQWSEHHPDYSMRHDGVTIEA